MAKRAKMDWRDNVTRALNKLAKVSTPKNLEDGMSAGLQLIHEKAVKITPVDTGNLRGSFYTETRWTGNKLTGIIGNTAVYAAFVHEINRPYNMGEWKYLEKTINENQRQFVNVLIRYARKSLLEAK